MQMNRIIGGIVGAAAMFVAADVVQAASTLTWAGGTGFWNTDPSNQKWLDSGNNPAAWTAGNDAVFNGGTGTVTVTSFNSTPINPNSLTVQSAGYIFAGNFSVTSSIQIKANAEFGSNPFSGVAPTTIDSDVILTLTGSPTLRSISGSGSVALNNATSSIGVLALNTALTQTGGAATNASSGQAPAIGKGGTGSWKLSTSGSSLSVGTGGVSNFYVGRDASGNGTLQIDAGTVTVNNDSNLRIGYATLNNSVATGVVNVSGGTLTVSGAAGAVYVGNAGNGSGALNISGTGVANIDSIRFGKSTDVIGTNLTGTLAVSGGTLNVGASGIALDGMAASKATINLSGGTVGVTPGAIDGWSSSVGMNLLSTGTGIATFRADDGANTPTARNITLSGKLTGQGALNKTGAGTLTLSAANDYSGGTTITAGTLALGASGSIAGSSRVSVASGATFDVSAVSAGYSIVNGQTLAGAGSVVGGVKLNNGATIAPGFAVNSGAPLSLGSLALVGGSTLDLGQSGDVINAASLSYTGPSAVNVIAPSGLTSTYTLLSLSSGVPDKSWFQLSGAPANYALAVQGSDLVVTVPEPAGMAMLLGFGALGLLSGRRRRRA